MCIVFTDRLKDRSREAGNTLTSWRKRRGLFKESYSQSIRCVVVHNMRASEGGWAVTQLHPDGFNILSWLQLFSRLVETAHWCCSHCQEKKKKKKKGSERKVQWWSNESPPQIKHFLLCNSSSWHHQLLLRRVGDVFQCWTCTHVYVEVSAGSFQNAAAMFSSSFFVLIRDVMEPTRQVCLLRVRGRRYSSVDFTGLLTGNKSLLRQWNTCVSVGPRALWLRMRQLFEWMSHLIC